MVDTVVIKTEPTGAPEGHDQKMIEAVDNANTPPAPEVTPPTEDRPEWLPEKFASPEDLAKAYAELESKLGKSKPDAAGDPTKDAPAPANATPEDAGKALADKGLNLSDFSAEFAQTGALSDESYEKLAKAGYDRNLVDQFIEGQKARAAQYETTIKSEVGGSDRYNEMVTWAKANLSAADIEAYNASVSSGNQAQARLAALGLKAQFEAAVGNEPQRTLGGTSAASDGDVYESVAQLTAAMSDPRYKTDPAYRNKVQAKLARSNVF